MPVMRTALIALSHNKTLQDLIVRVPVSRKMAMRFVAGETLDEAIEAVRGLNQQGMIATLDHLGEKAAAARLMKAVERVTADPSLHTPDLGGKATTKQVTEAVVRAIERENE